MGYIQFCKCTNTYLLVVSPLVLPGHQAVNVVSEEAGALVQAGVRDADDLSRPVQPGLAHGGLRGFPTLHVGGNHLVGRLCARFRVDVHHLGLRGARRATDDISKRQAKKPRVKTKTKTRVKMSVRTETRMARA